VRYGHSTLSAARASRVTHIWLPSAPLLLLYVGLLVTPLIMTVFLSFQESDRAGQVLATLTLDNWRDILSDQYYHGIFARTFRIALLVTGLAIALGAPEAYILSRTRPPWRSLLLLLVLTPLLISVIARTLGWTLLFGPMGPLSNLPVWLGLSQQPVQFLFTETGIVVALTHVLTPFMVLSVWASLQQLDPHIEDAATSLGASRMTVFRRVVLPQVLPGVLAGTIIVFALAASAFATPAIIGGRRLKVASLLVYDEFVHQMNWPLGAGLSILLLLSLGIATCAASRLVERRNARLGE
jgi:putative spermidine/putrescine transport system permease protein